MNRKKITEIIKFSIRKNIQNKWFVVFNVFLFIFILIMTNASNIRQFLENNNIKLFDDEVTIEYIDTENLIEDRFTKKFEGQEKITVKQIEENTYTAENIPDNLLVVETKSDENKILSATITSKEGMDLFIYNEIVSVLEEVRLEVLAEKIGAKVEELENLNTEIEVERVMLGVDAENSETKEMIQYISTILVYMVSIFIFSKIANEIAQEKVSKSIEYVLTSVTAKEYLLAKIISITVVVLIQGIYILAYYFIGNIISTIITLSSGVTLEGITSGVISNIDTDIVEYILIVFVYAVLTIILMSIIQATLSSKTTSISEAGNTMTFLMVVTIAVYMLTFVLINPYTNMTPIIYILSCIPLVSNYFIPAIIIIGQATGLQIFISLILLVISIPITFNICSGIFKNGVLDYSRKNKKKEKVKKEITLKEEQEIKIAQSGMKRLAFVVGMSIILMLVSQFLVQALMEMLIEPTLRGVIDKSQLNIISNSITSIISMTLPALFILMYVEKEKNINKKTQKVDIWVTIFLVAIVQILSVVIQTIFGLGNDAVEEILSVEGLDNIFTSILFFIYVAIVPAIFEELYFRKALIDLTRKFGDKFAIIFSSILFGIIHMNIVQGIFAFLMGIILGNLYIKTKTMKWNIIVHALNNGYAAIATIILYNNLEILGAIVDIVVLTVIVLGGINFCAAIFKKLKNKEKIFNFDEKIIPDNFKYIFSDFTFILSLIFIVCSFIATEALLKIL